MSPVKLDLSEAQRAEIVSRAQALEPHWSIAASFGISRSAVGKIARYAGVGVGIGNNQIHRKGANHNSWKGGRRPGGPKRYTTAWAPGHPRAHENCVYEHILIAERVLGKFLPLGAQVHHADGNHLNNSTSNLVICQDRALHATIHQRMRAVEACGHAGWRKCRVCKKYDAPENIPSHGRHTTCLSEYNKAARRRQKGQT